MSKITWVARYYLSKEITIDKIITFEGQMFVGRGLKQKKPVATSSLIFIATKSVPNQEHKVKIVNYSNYEEPEFENLLNSNSKQEKEILQNELYKRIENWNFITKDAFFLEIDEKIKQNTISFDHFRRLQNNYDEIIIDGSVNINISDLSAEQKTDSYLVPILRKDEKVIKKYMYCNSSKIKHAQGSRDLRFLTQRNYKIIWRYQNPTGFHFSEQENCFPKFMDYCIASNNKLEIIFLYALLSSNFNDCYFKNNLQIANEKSFLLGLRAVKTFLRIPKVTQDNIFIKNEIVKQTETILEIEKNILSDFIDFKNIKLQKFDKIEVFDNYLVLNKENTQIRTKIVSNLELIKLVINNLETDKIILLSELKQLPVIDNDFQSEIKQYIDNLIFSLYFDIKLSKIGFENKYQIQEQIEKSLAFSRYVLLQKNKQIINNELKCYANISEISRK